VGKTPWPASLLPPKKVRNRQAAGVRAPPAFETPKMALRKVESANASQLGLRMGEPKPTPALRAVHVTVNNSAREIGLRFYPNWRVPSESVISRVFANGGYSESAEDLSWWVTSDGNSLNPCPVLVKAKKGWDSVQALLVPQI